MSEPFKTLTFLNFPIEFFNNDSDEKTQDEECHYKNKQNVNSFNPLILIFNGSLIDACCIYSSEHDIWPLLQSRNLKKCKHWIKYVIIVFHVNFPLSFKICWINCTIIKSYIVFKCICTKIFEFDILIVAASQHSLEQLKPQYRKHQNIE